MEYFHRIYTCFSSLDSETIGNGGWSQKLNDENEDSDSSSSSSSSADESSTTERQVLEEQLINNSSDDSDHFNAKLRSKTLPEIYSR